jgi:ribonucleoside-diphosphate reductase alpha chain
MNLEQLKEKDLAPVWLTLEALSTLQNGYLLTGETPRDMYKRLSATAASILKRPDLESEFFTLFWNNWLCPATPVASNLGTERGLPISCYGTYVPDSIDGIFQHYHEVAMLTKNGGGVGSYWGNIRARGTNIKGNGKSEGVVPWLAVEDRVALSVGQGGVRRAGLAEFIDIEHGDAHEFMNIRRALGDVNRQCLNLHHGFNIGDQFMQEMLDGNKHNRQLWQELLKTRVETGEPYMMFKDTAQRTAPFSRKINNTQLCTEIFLPNDEETTYVCCLSSLNLARWDEWKDYKFASGLSVVELSVYFLDAVMSEFATKASSLPGFEKAVKFATKARALGLGVLGYHTLLQQKLFPFDSFQTMMLNAQIFSQLKRESETASVQLGKELGIPDWCKEEKLARRNLTLLAIAPTMSNSIISGGMSAGIEPLAANLYSLKSAKGTFIRRNTQLEQILIDKNINTIEVWEKINKAGGSVQNLKELSAEEKEIFKTAREINQFAVVKQAGQRQKFLDQGQSLNLFFNSDASSSYIHKVHLSAWNEGLKSLYYLRSESVLRGNKSIEYDEGDCASCQG